MTQTTTQNPVASMIRRVLGQKPEVTATDLYPKAVALDRRIKRLSLRQFHCMYVLPAKRAKGLVKSRA